MPHLGLEGECEAELLRDLPPRISDAVDGLGHLAIELKLEDDHDLRGLALLEVEDLVDVLVGRTVGAFSSSGDSFFMTSRIILACVDE